MFNDKNPLTPALPPGAHREDAVFIGWQENASGLAFALYEITAAGHPALGSTVSEKGLRKLKLQVPVPIPEYNAATAKPVHSLEQKKERQVASKTDALKLPLLRTRK